MDESQKVTILMAEYNTLRAEVLAARSYSAQALGITAAVMMGVVGFCISPTFKGPYWPILVIAAIALAYLVVTFAWNDMNTRKFCERLRELEAKINRRAGERLLVWETDSGWGSMVVDTRKPVSPSNAARQALGVKGNAGRRDAISQQSIPEDHTASGKEGA